MADGSLSPCCHFFTNKQLSNIKTESINSYLQNTYLQQIQQDVLNGKIRTECNYCYLLEKQGKQSPRQIANSQYQDLIQKVNYHRPINCDSIKELTIRINNTCNLSCRTCSSFSSSKWIREGEILFPKQQHRTRSLLDTNPTILQLITQQLPQLEKIVFLGGEPLLQPEHLIMLDMLLENNNNINVEYVTNLSTDLKSNHAILKRWEKIKNLELHISIDGLAQKGEYIRHGLNWTLFEQNLAFITENFPHINIVFDITISIFNILHIIELLKYLEQHWKKYRRYINILHTPTYLSVQALPESFKQKVLLQYKSYQVCTSIRQELDYIQNFMMYENKSNYFFNFLVLTNKLDQLRNQNYKTIFPELDFKQND